MMCWLYILCLFKKGPLLFVLLIMKPLCATRHAKHGFFHYSQELSRLHQNVSQSFYLVFLSMSEEQKLVIDHEFYTQRAPPVLAGQAGNSWPLRLAGDSVFLF